MNKNQYWQRGSMMISAAFAIAACGDDSRSQAAQGTVDSRDATTEQIDQLCLEIAGGGTRSKSSCDECLENADAASDGDVSTATTVYLDALSGSASLGAKSQPGIVYPAGSKAAVLISGSHLPGSIDATLTTSLGGKQVSSECVVLTSDDDLALSPLSITSDSAFDSIDITLIPSDGGDCGTLASALGSDDGSIVALNVHEFCASYGSNL